MGTRWVAVGDGGTLVRLRQWQHLDLWQQRGGRPAAVRTCSGLGLSSSRWATRERSFTSGRRSLLDGSSPLVWRARSWRWGVAAGSWSPRRAEAAPCADLYRMPWHGRFVRPGRSRGWKIVVHAGSQFIRRWRAGKPARLRRCGRLDFAQLRPDGHTCNGVTSSGSHHVAR